MMIANIKSRTLRRAAIVTLLPASVVFLVGAGMVGIRGTFEGFWSDVKVVWKL